MPFDQSIAGKFYDNGGAVRNVQAPDLGLRGDDAYDNHASLVAAMAAAGPNSILLFPPGVYRTSGSNYILPDGQQWVASGGLVVLKAMVASSGAFIVVGNDCLVQGIRITSPLANTKMEGFRIAGSRGVVDSCWVEAHFTWGCFFPATARYGTIRRTRIEGATVAHGVEINGGNYCTVDDCEISGVEITSGSMNAVEVYNHGVDDEALQCTVRNCRFHDTDGGVQCYGTVDLQILNNRIRACRVHGIGLNPAELGDLRNSSNVLVQGNVVRDCGNVTSGGSGLNAFGVIGGSIIGNVFENNRDAGMSLNVANGSLRAIGNQCNRNRLAGIVVNNCSRVRLIGNEAMHNGAGTGQAGIIVSGGTAITLRDNLCTDLDAAKVQTYGILISGSSQCVVEGNDTQGNLALGIYCSDVAYANRFLGNRTSYGHGDACRVRRTTNQTIPSGAVTDLVFDAVRFDPKSMFVAPSQFYAREPGLYRMTFSGRWDNASGAGAFRQTLVAVYNAASVLLSNYGEARNAPSATTRVTANLVTPVFFMEQGGHCRVMGLQDSGGNLDLMSADAYSFEASLEKVG